MPTGFCRKLSEPKPAAVSFPPAGSSKIISIPGYPRSSVLSRTGAGNRRSGAEGALQRGHHAGVTRAADLKWWFNQQIASLGVDAEPWFEIHTAVQRFDPVASQAIPTVHPSPDDQVFQRGDVIHLDCGFNYLGFASDWQKVAYILRDGETDVPEGLKRALGNANIVHQAMASEPRPGMTGREATLAVMKKLEGVDFQPSLYSHAIGYHGHALGPSIQARDMELGEPPEKDSVLPARVLPLHRVQCENGRARVERPFGSDTHGGRRLLDRKRLRLLPTLSDEVVSHSVGASSTPRRKPKDGRPSADDDTLPPNGRGPA